MMSLARNSPPENYVVTPHRKRRPGFQNSPAQNPPFVPLTLSMCPPASYGLEDVLSLGRQQRAAHPSHLSQPHHAHPALSVLSLPPRPPMAASSPPPLVADRFAMESKLRVFCQCARNTVWSMMLALQVHDAARGAPRSRGRQVPATQRGRAARPGPRP